MVLEQKLIASKNEMVELRKVEVELRKVEVELRKEKNLLLEKSMRTDAVGKTPLCESSKLYSCI